MPHPKRFLPPTSALRALESFERTGNVTETGHELGVSQSAVSRQLKVLEEYLDTPLFIRNKKTINLTPAAQSYCVEVRAALDKIGNASLRLKANPKGGQLNVAMLPAFGVRWLAPKLPNFVEKHPEVTVNLSTMLRPFDFAKEPFHAAIHFGVEDWPDVHFLKLMTEFVVPVASPAVREKMKSGNLDAILEQPLLHLDTRPNAWERWATMLGASVSSPVGMLFDQFASMIQAAIHGMGVALVPTYLIEREIKEGQLVKLGTVDEVSIGSYFFVWPKDASEHQPSMLFHDWIACQTDEER